MKILIVTETLHAGGAETFVLRLAKKLNSLGVNSDILSLNPDIEDVSILKPFERVRIHRIQLPLLKWIKRFDRLLRLLHFDFSLQYFLTRKRIIKGFMGQYDIFHTHLMPVDLLFAQIKKQYPALKIVSTLHGDYNDFEYQWQQNKSYKRLNWPRKVDVVTKEVDRWVYISKQQKELFIERFKVSGNKLCHIYNGYESNTPLCPSKSDLPHNNGLTFIMVARGIQEKGWEFLIKAFLRLPGRHRLMLVGKGQFLDHLKAIYGSDDRIIFTGLHPNPVSLIAEADVFVFPSIYKAESLPTVIIESLYCGVPIISTEIGNVKEMLTDSSHGLAGILITNGNEGALVDQLTDAMVSYIQNRELLARHKERTKEAFKKFEMDVCATKYISLYQAVLT